MNIINPLIWEYIEQMSSEEPEILKYITRQTFLHQIYPRMISGKVQGRFLELISRISKPVNILEIGTFTAYATICLARGLDKNGRITTIEINPELEDTILSHLEKAEIMDQTTLLIGDALELIPKLTETYDLVFIDGDKEQYTDYFKVVFPLLKKGGIILADNVLWDGKITAAPSEFDNETRGIAKFNEYVSKYPETETVIIPLRDGVSMILKK